MEEVRIIILDETDLKQFGFSPKDILDIEIEEGQDKISITLKTNIKKVEVKKKVVKKKKSKKKSVGVKKKLKRGPKKGSKRGSYKNAQNGKKVCAKCLTKKDDSEFNKAKNTKDGLQGWCMDCQKSNNAEAYKKNKIAKIKEKRDKSTDNPKTLVPKIGSNNVSYTYNQIYKALKDNEFRLKQTARDLGISEKDIGRDRN